MAKQHSSNAALILIPQGISIFLALTLLPIILQSLPKEDYGLFQFIIAVQVWAIVLTAGNTTLGAKRAIARGKYGTILYALLVRWRLTFLTGAVALIGILLHGFLYEFTKIHLLGGMSSIYFMTGFIFDQTYPEFFIAIKSFKNFAWWKSITAILLNVSILGAAVFTNDILWYAFAQYIAVTLVGITGMVYVLRKYRVVQSFRLGEYDTDCYAYGKKLIPAQIFQATIGQMHNFITGTFFGFVTFASFSVASKLEVAFRNFGGLTYHLLYADFAKESTKTSVRRLRRAFRSLGAFSLALTLLFLAAGVSYIYFFTPNEYHNAIVYFMIISMGFPASFMKIFFRTLLEAHLKHREINIISFYPGALSLLIFFILGMLYGVIGVCIALAVNAWVNFLSYYYLLFRRGSYLKK